MRTKRLIATGLVALAGTITLSACGEDDNASTATGSSVSSSSTSASSTTVAAMKDEKDIVALAVGTSNLSTLVTAVTAADLASTLQGTGPFTVFAPTNAAFAALPQDKLTALLADKAKLTKVLTYHVVAGKVMAADVAKLPNVATGSPVKTVEGGEATIKFDGTTVMINGAKVTTADVAASNGVVHIIDQVILPPGVTL